MTEMIDSWHSYPKVFNFGHAAIADLLDGEILIEEKIDGSQFSFGRFGDTLRCRSHGQELVLDAPEKMFALAVETVKELAPVLHDGWTYRAEYLQKPKHNTLCYGRIPTRHLILFDINDGHEHYLAYEQKEREAARLGLEIVPRIPCPDVLALESFNALIEDRESVLGKAHVEGIVIKNYARFTPDGKAAMGKYVSAKFKETHKHEWKISNPGQGDILESIGQSLRTEARWEKSIQHLREDGTLADSLTDIGPLLKAIGMDVHAECRDEIKEALFKWAWPKIQRQISAGFPEWYKNRLAQKQFAETADVEAAR